MIGTQATQKKLEFNYYLRYERMKISFITTTINVPYLLKDYVQDAKKHHPTADFDVIVSGDKKTHPEAASFCQQLAKNENVSVRYYDPEAQEKYLEKFPELKKFLPWNCIGRRNMALIMAYEQGSDIIVTIDDDNFLAQEDYLGGHMQLGKVSEFSAISSSTGWFNICSYLIDSQDRKFYARGYPVTERVKEVGHESTQKKGKTVVNAGFWLGDPDIDAVTRLAAPIDVTHYTRNDNFALDIGTWAPFNSQNTALHRDCIPAYFLCTDIGRFDDIWGSYMVKRIADHLGDYVTFGVPLVKQDRNPHDLWVDADHERLGMQLTDIFCVWLRETPLTASNYYDCTVELIKGLKDKLDSHVVTYAQRSYVNQFIDGYNTWLKTIQRVHAAK